jgi:hypothetical protein
LFFHCEESQVFGRPRSTESNKRCLMFCSCSCSSVFYYAQRI